MAPLFFDSHLHLPESGEIPWEGLAGALAAAATRAEWPALLAARHNRPALRVALGVHPWHIATAGPLEEAVAALAEMPADAVGEIGLDSRHAGAPSLETQYAWCRAQCAVAVERRLPVVLHICGAWEGLFRLLKEFPSLTGFVHGFCSNIFIANEILRKSHLGLSFGGALLRPTSPLPSLTAALPLDRLLVESDFPYGRAADGAPAASPAALCEAVVRRMAQARNMEPDDVSAGLAPVAEGKWRGTNGTSEPCGAGVPS